MIGKKVVGEHVYKSYEDVTHVFITLVHIIHVLMDITFLYDLATNGKKKLAHQIFAGAEY